MGKRQEEDVKSLYMTPELACISCENQRERRRVTDIAADLWLVILGTPVLSLADYIIESSDEPT